MTEYRCTVCHKPTDRSNLVVRRIGYYLMGARGRMIKSRTDGWLCAKCLKADPIFSRTALTDSPGHPGPRDRS